MKNSPRKQVVVKAVNAEARTISLYPSTYQWDRMDERFAKGAWLLDNFLKNPVVLWAHDQRIPAIGKAMKIQEDESGLFAEAKFHEETDLAKQVFALFEKGFLNAFSVGFSPMKWIMEPLPDGIHKGLVYTEAELTEFSAVNVPANPGALVSREIAEFAVKALGENVIQKVKSPDGAEFLQVALPEPERARIPLDFEGALKYIIDLAKIAKATPMEKRKLPLLNNAIQVFGEIIEANQEGPSEKDLSMLVQAVEGYGAVIKNLYPTAAAHVDKALKQIQKSAVPQ